MITAAFRMLLHLQLKVLETLWHDHVGLDDGQVEVADSGKWHLVKFELKMSMTFLLLTQRNRSLSIDVLKLKIDWDVASRLQGVHQDGDLIRSPITDDFW